MPLTLLPWWLLAINVATAVAYAYDKIAARRGARRIRERTLLLMNALGGFVGAWIVFFAMRHKTRHQSFWLVQSCATVLWALILLMVVLG
jgi:uncharacterized membrane protein YsdA (DUF1294 family)